MLGPSANLPPDYFHPEGRSPETDELRAKVRITLEEEVARYFKENEGQVAIFDANVSSRWSCLYSVEAFVRMLKLMTPAVEFHRTVRRLHG